MSDIFISYAHEDRERAKILAKRLTEAGWSVWWDPELRAGEHFAEVIEEVLQQVRAVIVLWSAHSVTSRWVRAEANEGLRQDKLIPLSLDTAEPPLIFRPIHTGQFAHWSGAAEAPEFHKLLGDIQSRISDDPEAIVKIATAKTVSLPKTVSGRSVAISSLATLVAILTLFIVFDLPGLFFDWLAVVLGQSGSGLSPWLVQAFFLAVITTVAILLRKRWWPIIGRPPALMIMGAMLIMAVAATPYHWVDYVVWSTDHLHGRVIAGELDDVGVLAWDYRCQPMSLGSVPVDTQSGEFSLRYEPEFGARSVYLLIEKPGCSSLTYPISRAEWKSLAEIAIEFSCEADQ